jgi:hypothetical protein
MKCKTRFWWAYGRACFRAAGVTPEIDATGSVAAVESTLERLGQQREELEQLWSTRRLRLDLCLQLRLFERDALEVSDVYFHSMKYDFQIIQLTIIKSYKS